MAESDDTLIKAIGRLGAPLDRIADCICRGHVPGGESWCKEIPLAAYSDEKREEVLIRYTVGHGEFSADKKYNVLRMKMYKMDGDRDGTHDGVWEPMVPDGIDPADSAALQAWLRKRPRPPVGPLTKPEGPIDRIHIRAYTKAIWTFADRSSITAVGRANLHLVKFTDESQIFLVSVAAIITNGTERYEGAHGVKTALGSTSIPKGVNLFDPPGGKFGAVTVETFRIIRKEFTTKAPVAAPESRDEVDD
jgi:hypothetical protein